MPFPRHLTKKWGAEVGWECESCGKLWKDGWKLEAHHKIPTHMGGDNSRDNFILLCVECHAQAHEELARADWHSAKLVRGRLGRNGGRWR